LQLLAWHFPLTLRSLLAQLSLIIAFVIIQQLDAVSVILHLNAAYS
jgi:hypothetical protein